MSEEVNEGLTIDQNSPELEQNEESVEEQDFTNPEEPKDDIPMTKKVSERINQKVQEAIDKENAKFSKLQADYEKQIEDYKNKVRELQAAEQGISVDELIEQEESEEAKRREIVENDPSYKALLEADFNRRMQDTLKSIQDAYPEENLQDLDNLPENFYRMLQVGVDAKTAYNASVLANRKEVPKSTGSAKDNDTSSQGKFYTAEQVASMSQEEVHAHWNEIIESKKKW